MKALINFITLPKEQYYMRAALEVMTSVSLCWLTMSEVHGGGMAM